MIIESDTFKKEIIQISDKKDILEEENPFSKYLVYIYENNVIAFCYYYEIYDKLEISYIFVKDEFWEERVFSIKLNKYLIENNKDKYNITLEVKKDNINAIKLYKKFGFKEVALRKGYYNGIDGILMELKL